MEALQIKDKIFGKVHNSFASLPLWRAHILAFAGQHAATSL